MFGGEAGGGGGPFSTNEVVLENDLGGKRVFFWRTVEEVVEGDGL